jgi:hypothetical protein
MMVKMNLFKPMRVLSSLPSWSPEVSLIKNKDNNILKDLKNY